MKKAHSPFSREAEIPRTSITPTGKRRQDLIHNGGARTRRRALALVFHGLSFIFRSFRATNLPGEHSNIFRYFVAGIETKFTGSSCNDLVTSDGSGSTIISGHFDKTIRFWDTRTESGSNDILLQGKITSLDLSRGALIEFQWFLLNLAFHLLNRHNSVFQMPIIFWVVREMTPWKFSTYEWRWSLFHLGESSSRLIYQFREF